MGYKIPKQGTGTGSMLATFEANTARNTDTLEGHVRFSDRLLLSLYDPEHPANDGAVGRTFLDAFLSTHCTEQFAGDGEWRRSPITYAPFDRTETFSFLNRIFYKDFTQASADKKVSPEAFFISRIHERFHAIKWGLAPILHVSPYNNFSSYALAPFDWTIMTEITERLTCAIQAWLGSRATIYAPYIRQATDIDPISVNDFEALRDKSPNLAHALERAFALALNKRWTLPDAPHETFADYYHRDCLTRYEEILQHRADENAKLTFVRMDYDSVRKIGQIFGFDVFANKGCLKELSGLSPANMQKVADLHKRFVLGEIGSHPFFKDVVADPVAFLASSKAARNETPITKLTALPPPIARIVGGALTAA